MRRTAAPGATRAPPGTARWSGTPTPGSCWSRCPGGWATTNNVAEYSGLIAGLRAALKAGAASVEARMDSKLVVEQMSGRWKIKHPHLRPLASEAAGLARELGEVTYTWVPRARNAHADRLANEAMDAQAAAESRR